MTPEERKQRLQRAHFQHQMKAQRVRLCLVCGGRCVNAKAVFCMSHWRRLPLPLKADLCSPAGEATAVAYLRAPRYLQLRNDGWRSYWTQNGAFVLSRTDRKSGDNYVLRDKIGHEIGTFKYVAQAQDWLAVHHQDLTTRNRWARKRLIRR